MGLEIRSKTIKTEQALIDWWKEFVDRLETEHLAVGGPFHEPWPAALLSLADESLALSSVFRYSPGQIIFELIFSPEAQARIRPLAPSGRWSIIVTADNVQGAEREIERVVIQALNLSTAAGHTH